jgi:hypothetical protein
MTMPTQSLRVAVVWGDTIHRERTFLPTSRPEVRVGEGDTNDFSLPAPQLPEHFRMFVRTDEGYRLRLPEDIEARVTRSGEEASWSDLVEADEAEDELDSHSSTTQSIGIDVDDWGVVELGHVELFFQVVEHRDVVPGRGLRGTVDGALVLAMLAAALLLGGIVLTAFLSFDPSLEYDQPAYSDQWARVLVDDVKEPIEDKEDTPEPKRASKAADGEEGKVGEPDLENETELAKVEGPEVDEVRDPSNMGVTKALSSELLGGGPLENMFGNQDGFDARMNASVAGEPGEFVAGRGTQGLSMRGDGRGGPGDNSFGQIGGLGDVNAGGVDDVSGDINPKQEKEVEPILETGNPMGGEFCDPGEISRVVQKRSNAIRYCYERELQQHPDMGGKIVAQWKIMMDGSVSGATIANSTLESASGGTGKVERCLTRVIGRMRFAEPDGGICVVNFPFVFSGID